MRTTHRNWKIGAAVAASVVLCAVFCQAQRRGGGPPWLRGGEKPWVTGKREVQDKIGGVPPAILKQQSLAKVKVPSIDEAVKIALKAAATAAGPLIDSTFHTGRRLTVPDDFKTIQQAVDAAKARDVVLVRAGTYYEQVVMKDGVKLVSDPARGGDKLASVPGARLKLPRRTLRTIIDGSRAKPSRHGMFDFGTGVGRKTIIDGFTIQNLPKQNHHIPGHAHGLNVRGASPVIMNCYIRRNGSTAIGNHVVYKDQNAPMPRRDLRRANITHEASAVIYNNILCENLGLGIGSNHLSTPHILGNEVFKNDDSDLGEDPTPGMGAKHGAAPVIIGNIVHDNPGGGILCKVGAPQGANPIDRPTQPTIVKNVIYSNGRKRPLIGSAGGGSKQFPIRIVGNYLYDAGLVGIGLREGAVAVIEGNVVCRSAKPGIAINGSTALKLNRNQVTGANAPGFVIVNGATVHEMKGNAADGNKGPRFMLHKSTIKH